MFIVIKHIILENLKTRFARFSLSKVLCVILEMYIDKPLFLLGHCRKNKHIYSEDYN